LLSVGFLVCTVAACGAADERTVWKYDKGSFEKTGDGKWVEKAADGTHHKLEEKDSTDKYIELYDKTRKLTFRLSETTVAVKGDKDKGGFRVIHKGGGWGSADTAKNPDPKNPDTTKKTDGPFSESAVLKRADKFGITDIAVSPDGKYVTRMIGTPQEPEFAILDVATNTTARSWKLGALLEAVAWSADGTTLAGALLTGSSQFDKKPQILVFDTKTGEQRAAFEVPTGARSVAISADGSTVAATSGAIATAGYTKAWDVAAKKEIFSSETKAIQTTIGLSANGKVLSTNGGTGQADQILVYELPSGKALGSLPGSLSYIMSRDGTNYVEWAQVTEGKNVILRVNVWDVNTAAKGPRVIKAGKWMAESAAFINQDRHFALAGGLNQDEVRVYDMKTLAVAYSFKVGQPTKGRTALRVKATPDSSFVVTYGTDRIIRLWTTPFGEKRNDPAPPPKEDK
jgi:WD40 repeat protein